jgi:hypothetical protein
LRALMVLLMVAGCGDDARPTRGEQEDGSRPDDGAPGIASDAGVSATQESGLVSEESGVVSHEGSPSTHANDAAHETAGSKEQFLRIETFVLKTPALVLRVLGLETAVTSDVQAMLDSSLHDDAEPKDGNVDLSMLLRLSGGGDPTTMAGKITFGGALCPYPLDSAKACSTDSSTPFFEPDMSYSNANKCELKGASQVLSGACFQTNTARMAVSLPLFGPVMLDDAQLIGSWAAEGKAEISDGFVRGFISEQTAMATKIRGAVPSHLALVGIETGAPLTSFLSQTTRENGPSGAGWWFLAQFSAKSGRFEAR